MNYNDLACNYTKQEILEGYLQAEKPYEVCAHTNMGGYMEFMPLERSIMFQENAEACARNYARNWGKSENIKSICVRKNSVIVYEVAI